MTNTEHAAKARFYITRARAARLRGQAALSRGFLGTAKLHRECIAEANRAANRAA